MRVARQLAGLIALGEERERRMREQVNAEALLRSDELKTALLRAVSHDLRSPLQAIAAASGGLRFAALDDDEQELLDTIGAESSRMSRMIENLLDLSRLNAGALPPAADWLDPRELVEAAVAELFRGEPQTRVRVEAAADVPLVRGDGPQLQRVVVNVVENALKFSRADQRGRGARRPAGGASSRSRCATTAPASHPRTPSGSSSPSPAAAARATCPDRGSASRSPAGSPSPTAAMLRLSADDPRRREHLRPRAPGGPERGGRVSGEPLILVVDDERPIRRALEVTLTKAGYRVATAGGAAEALTAAALTPPDLVILDLMLPDGDGAEVCAELRDWLTGARSSSSRRCRTSPTRSGRSTRAPTTT